MNQEDKAMIEQLVHNYAVTGILPHDGWLQPVVVDLKSLSPTFLDIATKEYSSPVCTQAAFLKRLYSDNESYAVNIKGVIQTTNWSVGRRFGTRRSGFFGTACGPDRDKPVKVMVITPQMISVASPMSTGLVTTSQLCPLSTGCREFLFSAALESGFTAEEVSNWYITSMVKFDNPNADGKIPADWVKECYPWLCQEIALLRPDYVVCAGVQILKKFHGAQATHTRYRGLIKDCSITLADGGTIPFKTISLPAFGFTPNLDGKDEVVRQLSLIHADITGVEAPKEELKHYVLNNAASLSRVIAEIREAAKTDPKRRIIAVDMEWEGEYPDQEGAHVLTVQFSSAPGEGYVVPLWRNGESRFKEGVDVAVKLLETILTEDGDWKPRLGGHFLRADMPWLLSLGISEEGLRKAYQPAETFEQCRWEGGWDTGLAYHAYRDAEEVGDGYGLKVLALKECGVARYDDDLLQAYNDYATCSSRKKEAKLKVERAKQAYDEAKALWRTKKLKEEHQAELASLKQELEACKAEAKKVPNKIKPKGFGCIPEDILWKYGAWDADATRRLIEVCFFGDGTRPALLDDDGYGNSSWEPFWRAHRASWGFGEMERTGFVLDVERLQKLSTLFVDVHNVLLGKLRDDLNWPDFNPNSSDQRRGLLYGPALGLKKDGTCVIPEGAVSYDLTPIRATDKTEWGDIDESEQDSYTASTDSLTVSIFAQEYPQVRLFKDICKLGRTLAGNIRPMVPVELPSGNVKMTWEKGIYTYMRPDGTVHTHLSQTKKTGRASSYDPPMQNIGKSAEAILQNTLGYKDTDGEIIANYPDLLPEPMYLYPCRTILKARPGNVLIESDFTGAELAVMAWASGDKNMIEHVRRNALPEDDPDYYDIHSHIAVRAFHLDCEPTKKGLASIHKKHLRVAAKAVVFGIPYGRGVRAILLQCQGDGVYLSEQEGQDLLDSYFSLYPATRVFLNECKESVESKRYVKTLFNRCRRFPKILDQEQLAKAKREACNAPIQGTVADSINNAIYNLMHYKETHPELPFTLNMQIHDALVLETAVNNVKLLKKVIQECMVENNPVVVGGVPHYYGLDSECYYHWGEELTEDICQKEYGLSLMEVV